MSITMFSKGSAYRNTAVVAIAMIGLAILYLGAIKHLLDPYQDKKMSLDPYLEFSAMNQSDEDSISFEDWVAKKDFEPISKWDDMASRENQVYWFRFKAQDVDLPEYVPNGLVELNEGRRYWTVKSLSLYLFQDNQFQLLSRSRMVSHSDDALHSGGYALPFSVEELKNLPTFYIRAEVRENFQPHFRLWKQAAWQQQFQYKQDIIFSLNLGILFCLLVFSGLSALSQRSRMLGAYFGYLLVSSINLINVWQSQTGNWLFWPQASYIVFGALFLISVALGVWLLTLFTRDYLNISKKSRDFRILRAINILNILFFVSIIASDRLVSFHLTVNLTALRDLSISALFLYVGYCSLKRYRRHAILYMLAFSIMFLLTASFHLIRLCYLPEWPYPLNQLPLQDMGLAAGSFILALAMVDRLKALQTERDKAQKEALNNLEQLHKVEESARKELSIKVEERTRDLDIALKDSQQANEAKNAFLANMSHELRTPLNAIIGYAQLIQGTNFSKDKLNNSVKIIEQSGSHLLELINDILNLSKIEADQIQVEKNLFNVRDLLSELVNMFRISTDRKGIDLKYVPKSLPRSIIGDRRLLRQILINVLGNAVKFTEAGCVTFQVTLVENSRLCIQVKDTGVGIDEKDLRTIFEPFTQVGSDEAKRKGTGLGLSISRKLVRAMEGNISVSSVVGEGSQFYIELPVAIPDSVVSEDRSETSTFHNVIGYEGARITVLIVDDDSSNRSVMRDLLESLQFNVVEASSGDKALVLLEEGKMDLMILDLRMPEMDGFTVVKTVRDKMSKKMLPVIASSAGVEQSMRQQALECGCNDFLAKPVNKEDLLEVLQKSLQLNWQYESFGIDTLNEESFVPVVADLLKPILEHAKSGYVDGVREALERLETDQPEATFFIQKVREMLGKFDLEGIVELAHKQSVR